MNSSVGLGVAGGPRKHGQMHVPPENEAQLAIELDRGMVRIEYVQERSFRARRDGSRERTHKLSREPLSSAGRVDAHSADFGEAVETHALPCHGDQQSIDDLGNLIVGVLYVTVRRIFLQKSLCISGNFR